MSEVLFKQMAQAVIDGDDDEATALAQQALDQGVDPLAAINKGYTAGMDVVGELYSTGDYFLPDLILGGEAMKAALAALEPALKASGQAREVLGTVVLGSVKGDIHEIGKSLVGSMLSANGFEVYDLGIDIEADEFVTKAREYNADIVALSALLTTTMLAPAGRDRTSRRSRFSGQGQGDGRWLSCDSGMGRSDRSGRLC